ncbi:hypothetical protein B4102_3686 [Heyndrickxia sporothermodurans]|uniref:Uncharacterized protein n=1 Tax=Heyndrickxia sporothermodurans TaxID=46224 RepID=A0A150KLC7_9BACI|nr:hypothetical protein B4102_3686 [Heyndrickxia sporothermodurans]
MANTLVAFTTFFFLGILFPPLQNNLLFSFMKKAFDNRNDNCILLSLDFLGEGS